MFNAVFACFDCRTAVRRPADDLDVRCPRCAERCHHVGNRRRIPPRHKLKAWTALRDAHFASIRSWYRFRGWHLRRPPTPRATPTPPPKLTGGLSRIDAIAAELAPARR